MRIECRTLELELAYLCFMTAIRRANCPNVLIDANQVLRAEHSYLSASLIDGHSSNRVHLCIRYVLIVATPLNSISVDIYAHDPRNATIFTGITACKHGIKRFGRSDRVRVRRVVIFHLGAEELGELLCVEALLRLHATLHITIT